MGREALAMSRKRMMKEWEMGWDVPHSHGGVKGHRNTKDHPGKAQPEFPRCHEGTGSDKARLRSCMDLSWLLPERVRGTRSWWETQKGPSVPPPGTSWHPEHLHGVGDTRGTTGSHRRLWDRNRRIHG